MLTLILVDSIGGYMSYTKLIMFSIVDYEQSIMTAISRQVKEWSSINVFTMLTLILVDSIGGYTSHTEFFHNVFDRRLWAIHYDCHLSTS